jgi:type VI secretion system secreted protein VgrG
MTIQKYKAIGTTTSTPVDDMKRKNVLIDGVKRYSQQVDLSDFIGMNPETGVAIASLQYEFRTQGGEVLLKGTTDTLGDTGRIFTHGLDDVILYVGDGNWQLGLDCKHEL